MGIALDVPSTYFAPGQYMDQFWAAGGTKDFDAISLHGYPHHAPLDNSPETIIGYAATVRACFARNSIPSTMPIWDTESSYGDSSYGVTDPNAQAGWLARSFLEHWSSGISRYYWYDYDDIEVGTLWTQARGLDSAGIAYQQVYTWMAGATMSTPCSNGGSGTVWTCGLALPNGVLALAVWNTAGNSSYSPPAKYTVYRDLAGNTTNISGPVTIGIKPILLQSSIPPQPPTGLKAVVKYNVVCDPSPRMRKSKLARGVKEHHYRVFHLDVGKKNHRQYHSGLLRHAAPARPARLVCRLEQAAITLPPEYPSAAQLGSDRWDANKNRSAIYNDHANDSRCRPKPIAVTQSGKKEHDGRERHQYV